MQVHDWLILIVTRECNLECKYCLVAKRKEIMDKETATKAVNLFVLYLEKNNLKEGKIKFFGGEPFIHFDLVKEIIEYAAVKNKLLTFYITTNGSFLSEKNLQWFANHKNTQLSISVNAEDLSKNNNLLKKVILAKKYSSENLILNVLVVPNRVVFFLEDIKYLYQLGFKKFNLLWATYILWQQSGIEKLKQEFQKIASFVRQYSDIYLKNIDIDNEVVLFNNGFVIDCNGDIFLNNLILAKDFYNIRNDLKVGEIKHIDSFWDLNNKQINFKEIIKRQLSPAVWNSNERVGYLFDQFIDNLMGKETKFKRADIKIGYSCNNKCVHCVQGDKRYTIGDRSVEDVRKNLEEAREYCQGVTFTGGEPTVRKELIDLVRYAKELGYLVIQIQSNGRMFAYRQFCEELILAGANEFSPALNGHSATIHDFLTEVPGSFLQVIKGIQNLKELGQYVINNTVISTKNYQYLPEIAKILIDLNVDQYQFAFVHIAGTAWKNKEWLVPKKSEIMSYVKKGLDIGINAGKIVMTEAIPYCLMDGYEDCIAEKVIPSTAVFEAQYKLKSYEDYRINEGKLKGQNCRKCKYFSVCEGPWREYPEMFGWDEFKPVK